MAHERVNTVWENHQHVPNWTCAPVNYVDTVLVKFPKRFHTVCERVPVCQTSIQRVPDVYVTCKYRAEQVSSDRPAVLCRATSVRLTYFPPLWQHNDSIKAPSPAFSLLGIKLSMLTSTATLIFKCMCCTQLGHASCVFGREHYMSL